MRRVISFVAVIAAPALLSAQAKKAPPPPTQSLTEAQQISSVVLALPKEMREGARVLGYRGDSKELVQLREGKGDFTCIANMPGTMFHAACYQNSMEPFMLRGRELRAKKVKDDQVDSTRFAEVKAGKLKMPDHPAAMYQLFGGTYDIANDAVKDSKALFVLYMPGATPSSSGLSATPSEHGPWIMFPGTPKAHMMLTPGM
jgi:hypothetical protein